MKWVVRARTRYFMHEPGIHSAARSGRDHGRGGALNKNLIKRNQRLVPRHEHGRRVPLRIGHQRCPLPKRKIRKKVRRPTSMSETTSLGGLGPTGGQKESQKNHFGAAELRPTAAALISVITHNRRTTEPYVALSSALIIPWSCVRIAPGLVRL